MELQQFIRDTLVGIAKGVEQARDDLKGTDASVNPRSKGYEEAIYDHPVAFDVAVTAAESVQGKAEGGIKVLSVGLSGGASRESSSEVASRIKFTLRMALPDEQMGVAVLRERSRAE